MYEFKLNYYFEIFKDDIFDNRKKFREKFIKNYGKYEYLEELILMIEKYQIKKYGNMLRSDDTIIKTNNEWERIKVCWCKRERYRRGK